MRAADVDTPGSIYERSAIAAGRIAVAVLALYWQSWSSGMALVKWVPTQEILNLNESDRYAIFDCRA